MDDEDLILEDLTKFPGVATMTYDQYWMAPLFHDRTQIYTIQEDTESKDQHAVVLSGYDSTNFRNAYWVMDSLGSRAPNYGTYRVTRHSSVQDGEKDPINSVAFPCDVWLE